MRIRWPRRRWATEFTLYTPRGPEPPYVSPARYWTRGGAQYAADLELEQYRADPILSRFVRIVPVEAGPFNEAAYLAQIERREAEHRRAWNCRHGRP